MNCRFPWSFNGTGNVRWYGHSTKLDGKQEFIPVGCVPSAVVAVYWGVSARGCLLPGESACQGVSACQGCLLVHLPLWSDRNL